ncbi:hypothetical protein LEP1GSC125_1457 [Leptospira mayottensis 200901122]|uniref:Uncharacterized protein n=1 Tax=Leptospira mayottensis 200901122 TaxID=1193010 RepID=A0AA87SX76_9LEPT|nr:hypothetical protein LEP1GSC125_1457 [Leptospira mayottensis 200901122]
MGLSFLPPPKETKVCHSLQVALKNSMQSFPMDRVDLKLRY